ncbi:MAG: ABC transporter permease [Salinivirgaceae bacterium]|jgi:putative ABC transport system permease protein|nr:ABC transporter permease [Salinivirgaceae bacterium]
MFDLDRWQEIIHTLKSNKLRTFLTAFGVFWGIFMLTVMLGAGTGLQNGIYRNMGDFSTNSAFMWTQKTSEPYRGFDAGRRWNFKNGDTKAILDNVPGIELLAPRVQGWGGSGATNAVYKDNTGSFSIYGDVPAWNLIDPLTITDGRFINQMDLNRRRKIAVIGQRVKEVLFDKGEDPLNKHIQINGVYFTVVGVFKSKKTGGQADNENQNVHIPFTTIQQIYNYGDIVGWYALTSHKSTSVSEVTKEVIALIKRRHDIAPHDDQAIGHFNVEEEFNKMNNLFIGINGLIWIVGIGTLLAGVIGVSNIMLVVVRERTKEIGIRRAIGAKPIKITSQIVMESLVLTALSGWLGLVFGVGLIELINTAMGGGGDFFYNPTVDFNIAVTALTILVLSGTFAGMIPARRALKIRPIEALRTE